MDILLWDILCSAIWWDNSEQYIGEDVEGSDLGLS
jgi:hypothetical protein